VRFVTLFWARLTRKREDPSAEEVARVEAYDEGRRNAARDRYLEEGFPSQEAIKQTVWSPFV
jgi:hypothetical protein